jgi:hypothetical protein
MSNNVTAGPRGQSPAAPLKLAVVVDSLQMPSWIYYLLEKLTSCDAIKPSLVVLNNRSRAVAGSDRGPVLFRSWAALDGWVRRARTDALRLRDGRLLLRSIRAIPVFWLQTCTTEPIAVVDIAPIKEADFDLLLYLGRDVLGVEISACSRLGTWSLKQGALYGTGAVPGHFWDMYDGNRTIRYGLQVIEQENNRTRVVYRSSGITNFLSLALNQNAASWQIAEFLVTQVSEAERLRTGMQLRSETVPGKGSISRTLGNIRMAEFLLQWAVRTLRHELEKCLFREQWSIALQRKAEMPNVNSDHGFRILRSPRDRFYADPFLIDRDGRSYLFFEDYRFASEKGVISCCEVDAEGNCGEPRVVLEREYHLSYPFLFTWQGELYMIPETRDNGTIEMYRASEFPHSWVHEAVLIPAVAAADSTLLYYHDKWWLFTAGVLDHASPDETLFLFFANSPLGPWTAHRKNPIVSDARHARPAGCLYIDNGQLIRPGQDCSEGYGYAAHLHRVDVLSETDYQETLVTSITPDWIRGSRGIHTFNQSAQFRVIDCRFLIPRFGAHSLFKLFARPDASKTRSPVNLERI